MNNYDIITKLYENEAINITDVLKILNSMYNATYDTIDMYEFLYESGVIALHEGDLVSCTKNQGYVVLNHCGCEDEVIFTHKGLLWVLNKFVFIPKKIQVGPIDLSRWRL